MPLSVATVATKECYGELRLSMLSLEQYHDCKWYVSCDKYVFERISCLDNVNAVQLINVSGANHNSTNQEERSKFLKVVLTKFDICEMAIRDNDGLGVLFIDSDMLFVNKIEDKVIKLFENSNIDAVISQHMTNNWQNEAVHGYYNVGMFYLRSIDMINKWRYLSENHKRLNMYYEQKPLEYVQRNYITANLPIQYNIGWWRFNEASTRNRLEKLSVRDNNIVFGDKNAVNFHVHFFKNSQMSHGQFLVEKIVSLLGNTENNKYREILEYINNENT